MSLPDEILSEILTPALKVPEKVFSSSEARELMTFSESSSAFLLVCKAWLRVATPLLYNTVMLRSKAQSQALAATLGSNPDLARFIKKLRVEGGYGRFMHTILEVALNVSDLYLVFSIPSTDSVTGLVQGLPLINPCRIFLHNWDDRLPSKGKTLTQTIETCIAHWSNLNTVEISHDARTAAIAIELADALGKSRSLTKFVIHDNRSLPFGTPAYMTAISAAPSLQQIVFQPPLSPVGHGWASVLLRRFYDNIRAHERLSKLIQLPKDSEPEPQDELNEVSSPLTFVYPSRLSNDRELEDALWGRILSFVFNAIPSIKWSIWFQPPPQQPTNYLAPLLVCKMFARLAIPHLYEHPRLFTPLAQARFSQLISGQRGVDVGHYVRAFTVSDFAIGLPLPILPHTPNLASVECLQTTNSTISADGLNTLGDVVGSTLSSLRGLHIATPSGRKLLDPRALTSFTAMRTLEWNSKAKFTVSGAPISSTTFGNLFSLVIQEFNPTLLIVLSQADLPSLRQIVFPATAASHTSDGGRVFFTRHGPKLIEATLSPAQLADPELGVLCLCSALSSLTIIFNEKRPVRPLSFEQPMAHSNLARIIIKRPEILGGYRFSKAHRTLFGEFITGIGTAAPAQLPALMEIMHPDCDWPVTERDIAKSEWTSWAERLLDLGSDVHLVGPDKVRWRRRLQCTTRGNEGRKKGNRAVNK
ncbi:hypothetical protein C8F01DRAFT_302540 [Mycena amicta]|nr:hypothetical protein C8F01DRAFT_302540 [Mycena amicta]